MTVIDNWTFQSCRTLKSITIPHGVTYIGSFAFSDCESLTEIVLPDTMTSIDHGAFTGCFALTNITIPESVTDIGYRIIDNIRSKSLTVNCKEGSHAHKYATKNGLYYEFY